MLMSSCFDPEPGTWWTKVKYYLLLRCTESYLDKVPQTRQSKEHGIELEQKPPLLGRLV